MKVGDLVQYRSYWSTWESAGIILEKDKINTYTTRYFIHWPGKPENVGNENAWESPKDIILISENKSEKTLDKRSIL